MAEGDAMSGDDGLGGGPIDRFLRSQAAENKKLIRQLRDQRARAEAAERERDAAVKERETEIKKARDQYDATGLKAENDRLKADMRERDHRAVFDRLAAEAGAHPDALALIYRESGYKAEAEHPDPAAVAALLAEVKARPGMALLFAEAETGTAAPPPAGPPPGSGQGRRDYGPGKIRIKKEQFMDGDWCMRNARMLQKARDDGLLEILE